MGFAVKRSVIPGGSENFREDLLVPIKGVSVVHEAIFMAVLAAHDDGTGGAADGVGTEGFLEQHAVGGEFVDFRSRIYRFEPAIISAYGVRSMVIGEEKDDIGPLFLCEGGEGE